MKIADTACPDCGATGSLKRGEVLACAPPGTYSIAGAQAKAIAYPRPRLTCDGCGWNVTGQYYTDASGRRRMGFDPANGERATT